MPNFSHFKIFTGRHCMLGQNPSNRRIFRSYISWEAILLIDGLAVNPFHRNKVMTALHTFFLKEAEWVDKSLFFCSESSWTNSRKKTSINYIFSGWFILLFSPKWKLAFLWCHFLLDWRVTVLIQMQYDCANCRTWRAEDQLLVVCMLGMLCSRGSSIYHIDTFVFA